MIESKVSLGSNVKVLAQDESHVIMQVKDNSGMGTMTMFTPFKGVYMGLCDMNMSKANSQMELNKDVEAFCLDYCKEGRIETEIRPGAYSILQEGQIRLDNRKNHKGNVIFPLKHFWGISIMMDPNIAQNSIKEFFPSFDTDIHELRKKFCSQDMPYIIKNDAGLENIMQGIYDAPLGIKSNYYKTKILELLYYLDALDRTSENTNANIMYKDRVEKIKMIYKQITENLSTHFTLEELSQEYDISTTSMKNGFKEIYGDSIYSFLKRYKINTAARMLLQEDLSVGQIARAVGYESQGKFSIAFKKIMGISPLEYRKNAPLAQDHVIEL
ncbi:MAG: AraC family transcriptional regulator [Eubacterium sp.]|nr:AraC family transcriptional regulator [Eubacterium sp.]